MCEISLIFHKMREYMYKNTIILKILQEKITQKSLILSEAFSAKDGNL